MLRNADTKLAEKNSSLAVLEKASNNSSCAECVLCPGMIQEVEACRATKIKPR